MAKVQRLRLKRDWTAEQIAALKMKCVHEIQVDAHLRARARARTHMQVHTQRPSYIWSVYRYTSLLGRGVTAELCRGPPLYVLAIKARC